MHEATTFGLTVLALGAALLVAVLSQGLTERLRIPAPAVFLLAAGIASDLAPGLGSLSLATDERLVTVALVLILFDGGMQIGLGAFRAAAAPILLLGLVGTLLTAVGLALVAHLLLGLDWRTCAILATALAPTDPAVIFSVLGNREITGRTGTILKGESGANDPVGIAMMVAILGAGGGHAFGQGVGIFALQMGVGAVVGLAGGWALRWFMRRPLPNEALYPLRTVTAAVVVYGAAAALHGSGFLAVLLAGVLVGDVRAPYKREVERFSTALGTLAEIVAFTVLGLTIDLGAVLHSADLWRGVLLAVVLALLVRPLAVGPLLAGARLRPGEKAFVVWGGLKGAVPILLGLVALAAGAPDADRVYRVVFVVVLVSVLVQGSLVPHVANRFGVPMRNVEPEPWALGLRFRAEPEGLHRHFVAPGSSADGAALRDLELGEDAWVSMVNRRGHLVPLSGDTTFEAGDEVLLLGDAEGRSGPLFRGPDG